MRREAALSVGPRPVSPVGTIVVPVGPDRAPRHLCDLLDLGPHLGADVHLLGLAPWGRDRAQTADRLATLGATHGLAGDVVDVLPAFDGGVALAAWATQHPVGTAVLLDDGPLLDGPADRVARSAAWWSDVPLVRRVHGGRTGQVVGIVEHGPGDARAADVAVQWAAALDVPLTLFAIGEALHLDWLASLLAAVPVEGDVELWPVAARHVPPLAVADASWVVSSATDVARRVAWGQLGA